VVLRSALPGVGRKTHTVSFDHITDCKIVEPAGRALCCVQRTLSTVHIDTTASRCFFPNETASQSVGPTMTLSGLKDPVGFTRLVLAMKRGDESAGLDS
jgi:hypothetical protein